MAQRNRKTLARQHPETAALARAARGEAAAAHAEADAQAEQLSFGDMMVSLLGVGEVWWVETATWVYIGRVWKVGRDYVVIRDSVRVHTDGRHGEFWRAGDAASAEIEATGGPDGLWVIPVDWLGPCSPWPHPIPKPH